MRRFQQVLLVAALLAGTFSGNSTLASAAASQPPIAWADLPVIAGFTLLALPAVLGFQVLLGNLNALRLGWTIFFLIAAYIAAAGLAALVLAWRGPGLAPYAFMFLVVGLAMLGGLRLTRRAFQRHFDPR